MLKANKAGYMHKETLSVFCCMAKAKCLCKITREIPKDPFISPIVCLRTLRKGQGLMSI